jgi:hypothetical protein
MSEKQPLDLPDVRDRNAVQALIAVLGPNIPRNVTCQELERQVTDYLTHPDIQAKLTIEGRSLSTVQIAEALFPEQLARGELIDRRKRLFQALLDCAKAGRLSTCVTRSADSRVIRGRDVFPWRWHAPRPLDRWDTAALAAGVTRQQAMAVAAHLGHSYPGTEG